MSSHGFQRIVTWTSFSVVALAGMVSCQLNESSRSASADSSYGYAAPDGSTNQRSADRNDMTMYYPTGRRDSSALQIRVAGPHEVLLGHPYSYTVNVTNMMQSPMTNVVVRNVYDETSETGATTLGYASPTSSTAAPNDRDETTRSDSNRADTRPNNTRASAQPQSATRSSQSSASHWNIGHLNPGETKSITIEGDAGQIGQIRQCLAVEYTPTVCTTLNVVNPELQASLAGPKQMLICDQVDYMLSVRNVGSGTARNVRVASTLPNNLTTREGQREIAFTAGDLGPNQSRDFKIQFRPASTGEFTIQPQVVSDMGDVKVQPTVIRVVQPVLDVQVRGPQWQYVGQPLTYQVTVKNSGDGPANDTVLEASTRGASGDLGRRDLGSIAPGQSKTAEFTINRLDPNTLRETGQEIQLGVEARAHCAESRTASAATQLRTIPALLLETVDTVDPVQMGQTTVYQITVRNQGSGAARNVRLTAKLPKGLEFVSAKGDSNVSADGQSLTFEPVQLLAAGASAHWAVTARANGSNMVQFELELRSDDLDEPAIENEPTRLYDPSQPAPDEQDQSDDD